MTIYIVTMIIFIGTCTVLMCPHACTYAQMEGERGLIQRLGAWTSYSIMYVAIYPVKGGRQMSGLDCLSYVARRNLYN